MQIITNLWLNQLFDPKSRYLSKRKNLKKIFVNIVDKVEN
jgi:hypothetical protein